MNQQDKHLYDNNAVDAGPVWSPNEKKIALFSNRDGKNEIYVMDADGSNVKRLTDHLSGDVGPGWSRDGRKILSIVIVTAIRIGARPANLRFSDSK